MKGKWYANRIKDARETGSAKTEGDVPSVFCVIVEKAGGERRGYGKVFKL